MKNNRRRALIKTVMRRAEMTIGQHKKVNERNDMGNIIDVDNLLERICKDCLGYKIWKEDRKEWCFETCEKMKKELIKIKKKMEQKTHLTHTSKEIPIKYVLNK